MKLKNYLTKVMNNNQLKELKEHYPKGTVIKLNHMKGENLPSGLKGIVHNVDDIGQIHVKWDNGSSLALHVDTDSFEVIEDKMSVIFIEPNKEPQRIEIDHSLKSMQKLVHGNIECIYPFDDEVALVCADEGKINGAPLNRGIYFDNGQFDIIAGNFFICYAPIDSDQLLSLPKDLEDKYIKIFKHPEVFIQVSNKIIPVSIKLPTKESQQIEKITFKEEEYER